jgi:hypothetical protein
MVDYTERISDGRLSKAFSISVTGNEGELEVSTGKGQRAELVVSVNAAKGAAAALGTCVVEVHDRFMIHNRTLQHIELMQWAGDASSTAAEIKQAITGAAREAREAMREKLGFVKSDSQASAASVYELPPGGQAPIKWHSGDEGRRFVALRSSKGFRMYDWCARAQLVLVHASAHHGAPPPSSPQVRAFLTREHGRDHPQVPRAQ